MRFAFTAAQEDLKREVAGFLEEVATSAEVRRLMETPGGYQPAVWRRMAELGLTGLLVPEALGGSGLGFVELVAVTEEMGSALAGAPFFSTVALATNAVLCAGDTTVGAELLPLIAQGSVTATVAFTEDGGRWDRPATATVATYRDGGWVLSGHKSFVVDGCTATTLIVTAVTGSGVSLFLVDGEAPGVSRTALRTVDQTRKLARIEMEAVPARLLGADGQGAAVLEQVLDRAAVALAAEQVGGAQRCLEMAVGYANVRYQFGRPIGSFQAIKHKCAEMLLEVELARSAAYYAGWAAASSPAELPVAAPVAKARASEAFARAAAENIQIHGGVGFTWDHDAHLYYRRARSSRLLLGDPAYHRELVARRIRL